jgi:hypothetical protein
MDCSAAIAWIAPVRSWCIDRWISQASTVQCQSPSERVSQKQGSMRFLDMLYFNNHGLHCACLVLMNWHLEVAVLGTLLNT